MVRRSKPLSDEDKALWKKVADSTAPLRSVQAEPKRPKPKATRIAQPTAARPTPPPARSDPFRLGEKSGAVRKSEQSTPNSLAAAANRSLFMDRKTFGKMKKGQLSPEARLDLHGMNLARAQPVLTRFVMDAVASERRLILVITGKGKHRDDGGPIPVRHGILRHQVPHWLQMMPLQPFILQVTPAHVKHGGHGAYYVYLRRRR